MAKKVVIIGAGGVGQVVAHKCAQVSEVFGDIVLASRTEEKCRAIAYGVKKKQRVDIRTARVNADETAQVIYLLEKEKPDLVINVALPYQDLPIMDACLATRTHYLDTANYEPKETAKFEYSWQWAYREKFEKAGVMALLGSGFDPGVTNVYTAYLAKHYFDQLEEIDIVDVNGGNHGQPFATNFNPEINIREVTAPCKHWENGSFVETKAMSEHRQFTCPDNVGTFDIYRMYHEELESLVTHIPTIRRAQFWMSFSQNYLNHLQVLQNVGMTRIDPVLYNGVEIVPLQFLKAVLPEPSSLGPLTKGRTCIGVIGQGQQKSHKKSVYVYNICSHEDAYEEVGSQAISYTTGVPAMIGAKMMMEGTWMKSGVWNLEQFDPDPFMAALNKYGLPWTVQDPPLVG
ncbi:MAG: saccharopine dehydrogenase family protein [Spirochaetales bacterium]|nr:saccharopine dehydrogenase family protein [Spirochaetales bacterium]